jgi:hypothetical protein
MNVMAAYLEYGDQAAEGQYDVYTIYWIVAHASAPNKFGGCKWHDRTWATRTLEYDTISWQQAVQQARDAVEQFDQGCYAERDHAAADMLASGVLIPEHAVPNTSDDEDMYDGVRNLYFEGVDDTADMMQY